MDHAAIHRRCPRAGLDPIDDARSALAAIALAVERPLRAETIMILLDGARRGRTIVVVSGTDDPDTVIEVVECITQGEGCEELGGVIVCSVRPHGEETDADIDRWLEMSEIASLAGIDLIEWFLVGRAISCPRDRLGEPPRW